MKIFGAVAIFAIAVTVGENVLAAEPRDVRNLVAMLRVTFPDDDNPVFGGGIVVAQNERRMVLITADHVVRRADVDPRSVNVGVEVRGAVGKLFAGRVAAQYSDRLNGLDLAVVLVEDGAIPRMLGPEEQAAVSPAPPESLARRQAVLVGNPGGRPWETSLLAEPIALASATSISFPSKYVRPGYSGGAVVDAESGSLLGMIIADNLGKVDAIPIAVLLDRLKAWGVEVALSYDSNAGRIAAARELVAMAYDVSADGLAKALGAVDERALDLYAEAGLGASVIREALGKPAGDSTIADRYLSGSRDLVKPSTFLQKVLVRERDPLDPDMRVPHPVWREEALINVAARVGNVEAVTMLLRAGASAHGFQDLVNTAPDSPRFLSPLWAALDSNDIPVGTRVKLIDALLSAGAIHPEVPLAPAPADIPEFAFTRDDETSMFGAVAAEASFFARDFKGLAGRGAPKSPDLCEKFPESECAKASKKSGVDWCAALRSTPRLLGSMSPPLDNAGGSDAVVVRYFLGADRQYAYLLGQQLSLFPGYALIKADSEGKQLSIVRFTDKREWNAPACKGGAGGAGEFCWRSTDLLVEASGMQATRRSGDPMKISSSCADAGNALASHRAEIEKVRRLGLGYWRK